MVLFVFDRDEMAYLTCILKLAGSQLKPNSQRRTQFSSSQLRFPVELSWMESSCIFCCVLIANNRRRPWWLAAFDSQRLSLIQ